MYHHQGRSGVLASKASLNAVDRRLLLQGAGAAGDAGLVLSTDAKPRLKWTPELHERFIEAVNQLGGANKATPKTIMRLMGIPGLTLYHLKSHLQKYRLSKNLQAQAGNGACKGAVSTERLPEASGTLVSSANTSQMNKTLQISEALQMQIEVQKRLHEQLEVQRHLQLRIEAQGKYLQSVLEKAQETLGRQNFGSAGLEAAKVQLSELVSEVSNECGLNTALAGARETPFLQTLPARKDGAQFIDCSMDSCLTSVEGTRNERETRNSGRMGLEGYGDDLQLGAAHVRPKWAYSLGECRMYSSASPAGREYYPERMISPPGRDSVDLPAGINIRVDGGDKRSTGAASIAETRRGRETTETLCLEQPGRQRAVFGQGREKTSVGYGHADATIELDLNAQEEDAGGGPSRFKQFDLNGYGWS